MFRLLRHPLPILAVFAIPFVAGLVAWPSLPVELLPSLKYPRLTIVTSFGNASSEEVESLLTRPVEEAVGTVSGLRSMTSVSSEGISSVVLRFNWGANVSLAAAEVREKLDLIADEFPRDVKLPIVEHYDPTDSPILSIALTGPQDLTTLYTLAKDSLKPELETVNGVATVRISGGLSPEIHVLVDQGRLAAQSVDLRMLVDRLEAANINFPGGSIIDGHMELPVRTVGRFKTLEEIGTVSLSPGTEGGTIRISDVAEISQSHTDRSSICRVNGQPAVLLGLIKEPTENTVQVCRRVLERLGDLVNRLPKDARLDVVENEAPVVEQALKDLRNDMLWGSFLAFGVLLFFLRSFESAGLIMLSIPVSVVSTFAFMSFAGVSLNMMSIGGMALGVGMLVDCSIVVLEPIHRKRGQEPDGFKAAVSAVNEVGASVVSGTLTTVAVLMPILFMTGMAQRLFRDFAFTMGGSVLMSLLVSIFLLPAVFIWTQSSRSGRRGTIAMGKPILEAQYRSALSKIRTRPGLVVAVCSLLLVASAALIYRLGFELLPQIDVDRFTMNLTLPADSSIEIVEKAVDRAEGWLSEYPETAGFVTLAGTERVGEKLNYSQDMGKLNEVKIAVRLNPTLAHTRSTDDVLQALRERSKSVSDAKTDFAVTQGPLTRVLGNQGTPEILRLTGDDLGTLNALAEQVTGALEASPLLKDVSCKGNTWIEHLRVIVDRNKSAGLGVSVEEVAEAVRAAIEGKTVGKFLTGDQEQNIRIRLKTKDRTTVEDLNQLPLRSGSSGVTLLGYIADVEKGKGPREILRSERRRSIEFHGNVLGEAISKGQEESLRAASTVNLPKGYYAKPGAQRFELMESLGSLSTALALAIMLVYAILVVQFESLVWPLVVLTSVPLTIVGPAVALTATGSPVSVLVLIGAVVLVGIVVNMAILMVATINDLRQRGTVLEAAVVEGSVIRFRPILMTTLTTALGALPVVLSQGGADQLNKPLALTLIAGLLASATFKLFGLPVVYELVARTRLGRLNR